MKTAKIAIIFILCAIVTVYTYKNGTYILSRWDASTIEKNKYDSIQVSYQASSNRIVVLEDNSMDVIFEDRDFKDPFEESFDFLKKNRIETYKHTIRSHTLYFFVKTYAVRNEVFKMCRFDRIINIQFKDLNGNDFEIFCRNEADKGVSYKGNMKLSEDERFLYELLIKNFKVDAPRWN